MKILVVSMIWLALSVSVFAKTAREELAGLPYEARIVALTLLAEAVSDGPRGMYAVGCVIQQRQIERRLSPAQVCRQKEQFTSWNSKSKSDLLVQFGDEPEHLVRFAVHTAKRITKNEDLDRSVVGFANHFCGIGSNPWWTKGLVPTAVVGGHEFYVVGRSAGGQTVSDPPETG